MHIAVIRAILKQKIVPAIEKSYNLSQKSLGTLGRNSSTALPLFSVATMMPIVLSVFYRTCKTTLGVEEGSPYPMFRPEIVGSDTTKCFFFAVLILKC